MTVANPGNGEIFTFRVYQRALASPTTRWANNYEVRHENGGYQALVNGANALADFHRRMLVPLYEVYRVVISTYTPDTAVPYNPDTVASFDYALQGNTQGTPTDQTVPLEICVYVKRVTTTGRAGKLMMRGYLAEPSIQAANGVLSLNPGLTGSVQSNLNAALTGSGADALLTGSGGLRMVLARGAPLPTNVREVNALVVSNATIVKRQRRWFNRNNA